MKRGFLLKAAKKAADNRNREPQTSEPKSPKNTPQLPTPSEDIVVTRNLTRNSMGTDIIQLDQIYHCREYVFDMATLPSKKKVGD